MVCSIIDKMLENFIALMKSEGMSMNVSDVSIQNCGIASDGIYEAKMKINGIEKEYTVFHDTRLNGTWFYH